MACGAPNERAHLMWGVLVPWQAYPANVAALSEEAVQQVMNTLSFGLEQADSAVSDASLEALAAIARFHFVEVKGEGGKLCFWTCESGILSFCQQWGVGYLQKGLRTFVLMDLIFWSQE